MSARLPLWLDLNGRRVLVVGAGQVAVRRVRALLDAGADVDVVSADPPADAAAVAGASVTVRRLGPDDADGLVRDRWLVVAATSDADLNAALAAACDHHRIWCSRADDAAESAAWWSATTTVDGIDVAVSSGDPGRSGAVRDAVARGLASGELLARRTRRGHGRVVLVGGGPGDPGLLTVRGRAALHDADLVIADRLGPTSLLPELPAGVEVVDAGKTRGGQALTQQQINELLVDRARAGLVVVRLKGGDPFVLGRGSEEVDACVAAGVEVEVVPGVSSATAAAALAGIALTERGITQEFTVVSGHVPPGDPTSTVDWARLAAGSGTLVLLMAVATLEPIVAALVAGGRDPASGAAIIERASLPDQRVTRCTLRELVAAAAAAAVSAPAVVVIGDVVRR